MRGRRGEKKSFLLNVNKRESTSVKRKSIMRNQERKKCKGIKTELKM